MLHPWQLCNLLQRAQSLSATSGLCLARQITREHHANLSNDNTAGQSHTWETCRYYPCLHLPETKDCQHAAAASRAALLAVVTLTANQETEESKAINFLRDSLSSLGFLLNDICLLHHPRGSTQISMNTITLLPKLCLCWWSCCTLFPQAQPLHRPRNSFQSLPFLRNGSKAIRTACIMSYALHAYTKYIAHSLCRFNTHLLPSQVKNMHITASCLGRSNIPGDLYLLRKRHCKFRCRHSITQQSLYMVKLPGISSPAVCV